MNKNHAKALKFLCITVLLLFGAPKINIKLGPLPLYLIDAFILITTYYARSLPKLTHKLPFKNLVQFILFMIILNELLNGLRIGTLIQPIYIMFRMSLAVSLFFTVSKIIRKPEHLTTILKYGLVGAFITTTLLITSSLPMTRGFSIIILSNPILTPNAVSLSSSLIESGESGIRGFSLVGVSILSGAFLNVVWPLLFLMFTFYKPKGILKYILIITIALVPVGVIMTYSRGAILALILVLIGIVFFQKGKYRSIVLVLLVGGYLSFSFIGFDSKYFFFDRLVTRTNAALNNPYENERESERIDAYFQPFNHLLNDPTYFFIGEGFAREKVANTKVFEGNEIRGQRADHAVFAKAYYAYGLITSLSIVILFFLLMNYTIKIIKNTPNNNLFAPKLTRLLFTLLLGFSSWFSFGHAAVSYPRGTMLMFFVFGLVASQRNFYLFEQQTNSKTHNSQ
ncbi:hypothetical protein OA501_02715 [Flavobacteriaceae bacterium]|nr:hypothetical protein [Flavobacteriaceae bacterium]